MNDHPQYEYVVDLIARHAPCWPPVVLDYGCGSGQIVRGALDAGMDAHGVDLFYDGGSLRSAAAENGLLGTRILELDGSRIPWAVASVDVVVANMVFEHIDAFEPALAEIARVLRPGGVFLNLFPSRVVWREGHIGIPFAHRFPRGDFGVRLGWAMLLRSLGAGYHRAHEPVGSWARKQLDWIDRWTHYKPLAEIESAFARHFLVSRIDHDFLAGRLRTSRRLRPLAAIASTNGLAGLWGFVASRLATHVFVLRKPREAGLDA